MAEGSTRWLETNYRTVLGTLVWTALLVLCLVEPESLPDCLAVFTLGAATGVGLGATMLLRPGLRTVSFGHVYAYLPLGLFIAGGESGTSSAVLVLFGLALGVVVSRPAPCPGVHA